MYRDCSVAVVVPAYNEEGLVAEVVESIPAYVDRVYVVDDASTDGTWQELGTVADSDENWTALPDSFDSRIEATRHSGRIVVLRHTQNQGAGGAVKTGYLAALHEAYDLVATIDGDGQMDPARLDSFLGPLVDGDAEYTKGSRFERRVDLDGMPAFRRFGNTVLTHLSRVVIGAWGLSDPVNGYTAVTRRALETIDVTSVHAGYGYGIDVLGRLKLNGCRVVDVAHPSRYGAETSSIRYHAYIPQVSRLLGTTLLHRLSPRRSLSGGLAAVGVLTLLLFLLSSRTPLGRRTEAERTRIARSPPDADQHIEEEPV